MHTWSLAWLLVGAAMAASCVGNSGDSNKNSGGSFCLRTAARLRACGLATEGDLARCTEPETEQRACDINCLLNAPCPELEAWMCWRERVGDLPACGMACSERYSVACGGGETVSSDLRCDGFADCTTGNDEVGCPTFDCGNGSTVVAAEECNGFSDCSNNADESNCMMEMFTCEDGSTIRAAEQCDGIVDCGDASDEAGCPPSLRLICN